MQVEEEEVRRGFSHVHRLQASRALLRIQEANVVEQQ